MELNSKLKSDYAVSLHVNYFIPFRLAFQILHLLLLCDVTECALMLRVNYIHYHS
jgi:hypothetical protein